MMNAMNTATTPAAWLGMAKGFDKPTVRICASCGDAEQAEAIAAAAGMECTHGLCAHHFALILRDAGASEQTISAKIAEFEQ